MLYGSSGVWTSTLLRRLCLGLTLLLTSSG